MSNHPSDFKEWAEKQLATIKNKPVKEAFMNFIDEIEPSAQKIEIKSKDLPKGHKKLDKFDRKVIIAEEFDGLIDHIKLGTTKNPLKGYPKPFKAGILIHSDYGHLYDQLVKRGLLEDTGKSDFIYFFTGEGKAFKKLNWIGDRVYLSVLMSVLCNNRIPWKHMETVFVGLNTKSMKATLSKIVRDKKNEAETFRRHCRFIRSFLSES